MPPVLSLALLVIQVASITYLLITGFKLIDENRRLRVVDALRESLNDVLESMGKALMQRLSEKTEELKKAHLRIDELKKRIAALECRTTPVYDKEPRYERVDDIGV